MDEGRRNFLKTAAGAGLSAAGLSAEAAHAKDGREQIHDIDKPFVNMSPAEFGNHMQNLSPDMQVTVWPTALPNGETGFHVITEPRPPHPLPKKWKSHEIGSDHYPRPDTDEPKS